MEFLENAAHVAEVVTALGFFVAIYQLNADHSRSRKEFAARLIWEWTQLIGRNTKATAKLIHGLDKADCTRIFNQEAFDLSKDHEKGLLAAIAGTELKVVVSENRLIVDESHSSYLRSKVTNYLNVLESVFVAWHYGVGEKAILDQQFRFMVFPEGNDNVFLQTYLNIAGGSNNYPMIFQYIKTKIQ